MARKVPQTISIDLEVRERLAALARAERVTLSSLVEEAITAVLRKHESKLSPEEKAEVELTAVQS